MLKVQRDLNKGRKMSIDLVATKILTPDACEFIDALAREFENCRQELLTKRKERQAEYHTGLLPDFLEDTKATRDGGWQVAPIPEDMKKRAVEITGPVDRKMIINALNSGADVFMADFEDSNSPTWHNCIYGQKNLKDAVYGTISLETPKKTYLLNENTAKLMVRPRGWHLNEKHYIVNNKPITASRSLSILTLNIACSLR